MKYLLLNEVFNSSFRLKLVEKRDDYWKYIFKTKLHVYMVEFKKDNELGWEASHRVEGAYMYPHAALTRDKVFRVTNTVINALKHFLKESKENMVYLAYIPTDDDKSKKAVGKEYVDLKYNLMNKRARIQKPLLDNLKGYKTKYYARISRSYLIKTICLVYKEGSDTSPFDNKMKKYDWNVINH